MASMNTRPFSVSEVQLPSQLWLMKRDSLPPLVASITVRRSAMNRKVWLSFGSASS